MGKIVAVADASQMLSGRRLIYQACRAPMEQVGWRPRASGWFTWPVSGGYLGVVAIGAASEHSAKGEAEATAYVGLRDDATEQIVCHLCDMKDGGYRQRTAVRPIGELMPGRCWREWRVTPQTAAMVAGEVADAVRSWAVPFLRVLAEDPVRMIEAARASAGLISAPGRCRVAVLMARAGQTAEAAAFAAECRDKAGDLDAAWAVAERSWTSAFARWAARIGGAGC
jgi:hypothetical protein